MSVHVQLWRGLCAVLRKAAAKPCGLQCNDQRILRHLRKAFRRTAKLKHKAGVVLGGGKAKEEYVGTVSFFDVAALLYYLYV